MNATANIYIVQHQFTDIGGKPVDSDWSVFAMEFTLHMAKRTIALEVEQRKVKVIPGKEWHYRIGKIAARMEIVE